MIKSDKTLGTGSTGAAFGNTSVFAIAPSWGSVVLSPGYALNGIFATMTFSATGDGINGIQLFSPQMPAPNPVASVGASESGVRKWNGINGLKPAQGISFEDPGGDNAVAFGTGPFTSWSCSVTGGSLEIVQYPVAVGMIHT